MPVTTRTRRARALRAAAQIDSDVDMEAEPEEPERPQSEERDDDEEDSNVDIEAEPEGEGNEEEDEAESEDEEDGDGDGDEDEEQDDEMQSEVDEPAASPPKASSSRLKIRLKMPTQPPSRFDSPIVESEDSNDSMPSTARPMTTRQAVLASVLDSSHVSLGASRQKKAPLNETELALRREETARKRKNLTEKKLEDEKLETINRLLKKQSRPRNKRTTAQRGDMDDIAPSGSLAGTRSNSNSTYNPSRRKKKSADEEDQEEEADEDGMEGVEDGEEPLPEKPVEIPTMYRWISTSRVPLPESEGGGTQQIQENQMRITFSVPVNTPGLVDPSASDTVAVALPEATKTAIVDGKSSPARVRPTRCAAPGCGNPFRYRLVKDWTRGACGISCLKVLEASMQTTTT